MFSFGFGEILVIGVVLLLFVGPDRLPQLMRTAGRAYGQLRRSADEMRRAFMLEADRADAALRVEDLEQRRREIADHRRKALESAGDGVAAQKSRAEVAKEQHEALVAQDNIPPGFNRAEWEELPEHLQQSVWAAVAQGDDTRD